MQKRDYSLVAIAAGLVICAALSRLVFYPFNFSPIIAMALFAGSVLKNKKLAIILPLSAMLLSDLLFEFLNIAQGFWGWGQLVNYVLLAGITIFGFALKKINLLNVAGFSIASSLIFFFISNASVWVFQPGLYASDLSGLRDCLIAGLPFLKNGVLTDLLYCGLLFGVYSLAGRYRMEKAVA
ncbi:MAG: hypothetical protein EOO01_01800 [Chitinophagaceae bacterium]|nr:MAG: hypothetical protein EOO01_01800 [Chitinophagaceae bacterium]